MVAPPFSRFFIGGENDLRGFRIRSISPMVFFPISSSVPQLNNNGTLARDENGTLLPPISFPSTTVTFPGADAMTVGNFEYRIPVAGPLTIAYFVDAGTSWILRRNQLKLRPDTLDSLRARFPQDIFNFPFEDRLEPVPSTSGKMRMSTGVEFQILMPVMNVPFRIFWARNVLRQNTIVTTPQRFPARELFPNDITFAQAIPFFSGFRLQERKSRFGFTVSRTF